MQFQGMEREEMPVAFGSPRVVAIVVAALVVGGGIAYALLGGGQQPAPGTEAPAAAPGGGSAAGTAGPAAGSVDEARGWAEAFAQVVEQVEAEQPDHAAVLETYRQRLQAMVRGRDAADGTRFDEHVVAALEAGRQGGLAPDVVAEVVDKVLQAALHAQIRTELRQALGAWGDADAVRTRLARAEALAGPLQGTAERREQAYGVELWPRIQAAFDQMRAAVDAGASLDFALGAQLLDKTLMKTFYLAAGGHPHGYAFKARASADRGDLDAARKEQAEGWGFYQALHGYLKEHDPEAADAILASLDLQATSPDAIDPERVNRLFVGAFLHTAADEFDESREHRGEDEGVITAYEGALFVDLIGLDLGRLLGQAAYQRLAADAEAAFQAARGGDQATFEAKVSAVLDALAQAEALLGMK